MYRLRKLFPWYFLLRRKITTWWYFQKHQRKLKDQLEPNHELSKYYQAQLLRTLPKRLSPLPDRSKYFIDKTVGFLDLTDKEILCVGCRNTAELDYFRSKGAQSIVGIDLFSEDKNILVMDMHSMKFPSDSFDLVYSSHSLEHSQNPAGAAKEFIRVAKPGAKIVIEVPVNFVKSNADLVDFKSVSNLLSLFQPNVAAVDWTEEIDQSRSGAGTDVVRTIFTIIKTARGRTPDEIHS